MTQGSNLYHSSALPSDPAARRLYWWHMPVQLEKGSVAGQRMLVACAVWLVSMFGLVFLIGLIAT